MATVPKMNFYNMRRNIFKSKSVTGFFDQDSKRIVIERRKVVDI